MKTKFTIALIIISIILSGCTRGIPDSSIDSFESLSSSQTSDRDSKKQSEADSSKVSSEGQNSDGGLENNSQIDTSSVPDSPDVWQMDEEYRKIEPDFSKKIASLYGLGVTNGHVLLSSAESDTQNFRTVMDYDLKNNTWQEVGNYDELNTMSSDRLQIGGKNYFAYEDMKAQYRMVCIDSANQEVSYPNTFEFFPPLAAYEAMDNKNFFLYLPDMGTSGGRQYHIYLYNTEENNYREIYTENYDETNRIGTIVQDISAQDQLLYLCCGVYEADGQYTYKIIVCNSEGEQQQEIVLDDLKDRLQQNDENIERFAVLGDCFFFKTLGSGSRYLYAYEDGSLRLLELSSQHLVLDEQRGDNLRDREQNPYYYFWDSQTKTLYPFNCQTKTFSKLPFSQEDDENLSISIRDNAEGNILMSRYRRDQDIPDYYYIPQSTILKYME